MTLWAPAVPVIRQQERHWCGPAALAAALGAFGVKKDQRELSFMTTEDAGTAPEDLASIARFQGFPRTDVRDGLSLADLESELDHGALAIAGVQWPERPWRPGGVCAPGHFVVVMRIQKGRVCFMDPLLGYGWLTRDEFGANWRDNCGGSCREHMAVLVRGEPGTHHLERVAFREKEFARVKVPKQRRRNAGIPPAPPPEGVKTVCCVCGTHIRGHKLARTISHGYCRECANKMLADMGFQQKNPDDELRKAMFDALSRKTDPAAWHRVIVEARRRGLITRALTSSGVELDLQLAGTDPSDEETYGRILTNEPGSTWREWTRAFPEYFVGVNFVPRDGSVNPAVPQCPSCKVPLIAVEGAGGLNCLKCMRWFPEDSGWLTQDQPQCLVCRRRLDRHGRCYKCDVKRAAESSRARKAREKTERAAAREAKKAATAERREMRKRPPVDPGQHTLFNPRRPPSDGAVTDEGRALERELEFDESPDVIQRLIQTRLRRGERHSKILSWLTRWCAKAGVGKRVDRWGLLLEADERALNTSAYLGAAYFWSHEYKHTLREATPAQRREVHAALVRAGLELADTGPYHVAAITHAGLRL